VLVSEPTFSYVIPVHNQIADLRRTVRLLVERLGHLPGSEVILVENGSSDGSGPLCLSLAAMFDGDDVAARVTTSAKGLGFAWRRGMAIARAETLVLTAADLPFGFTDLDGYLGMSPRPSLVMGSKTHPDSQVETSLVRRTLSGGFGMLRAGLLSVDVDTQGTMIIGRALAQSLLPRLRSGDFLIGAEIICWAVSEGITPLEVPIVYTASGRSTVSPLRDSTHMAIGLFALRRRLVAERRALQRTREVTAS
jgi:dolichyl-phosphate beta-glucosyltransferase